MRHLDLLGTELKSDFLCDLFDTHDVDVTYRYDRTGENLPDTYDARIDNLGLQFIFDAQQVLVTLFITPVEVDSHNPLAEISESFPLFESKAAAQDFARTNGVRFAEGSAEFGGVNRDWIRLEYNTHSVHYEFRTAELGLITLSRRGA